MPRCTQCETPAIDQYDGKPLCVDHYSKMVSKDQWLLREIEIGRRQARLDFAHAAGDPGFLALVQAEEANAVTNINIEQSIVGAVNTGTIDRLSVSMDRIRQAGSLEAAEAIRDLSAAIAKSKDLSAEQRKESTERLYFIAQQAAMPEVERHASIVKLTFAALAATLSTTADLSTLWAMYGPAIKDLFSGL
jgi:hypothetical protein